LLVIYGARFQKKGIPSASYRRFDVMTLECHFDRTSARDKIRYKDYKLKVEAVNKSEVLYYSILL
jgi:hypothetical protein